jgi:hypothetical protein
MSAIPPVVLRLYLDDKEEISFVLAFLQTWNHQRMRRLARRGIHLPHPYAAGIRYQTEDERQRFMGQRCERFLTYEEVLQQGWGDCDDLAPAFAAYENFSGKPAEARVIESSVGYHCNVMTPRGTEDPSRVLGMGRKEK